MVAELHTSERIPEVIGSYRIDEQIACGGMGSVYRAHHLVLDRAAAIKVLHGGMIDDSSSAVERMLQEARILEAIDHPTVVEIYDAGLLPDGRPWVAMELLDGQTLADHLLVHHRLSHGEVARIVAAVGDALQRSHSMGVIHRDVKPENIMLVPGDEGLQVKLIDWGIAQVASTVQRLTQHDYSPGTPCYMSPEQLRGHAVDGRTDTYALGVVAFEMISGTRPFDGPNPLEIAVKTLQNVVPRLPLQFNVPAPINALIRGMLAKDPARRPSLDAVRAAFADWRQQCEDEYADFRIEIEIETDFEDVVENGSSSDLPTRRQHHV